MSWQQGRDAIDRMLRDGKLVLGDASSAYATTVLEEAGRHLASMTVIMDRDPPGGCALAYEAASKALTAALVAQGLYPRAHSRRRHPSWASAGYGDPDVVFDELAVYGAVCVQFDPPFGQVLRPFLDLSVRRLHIADASPRTLVVTSQDLRNDLGKARVIIFFVERLLPHLQPFESSWVAMNTVSVPPPRTTLD